MRPRPVLSMVLRPVIAPVYEMLGSSPSVFATTLLLADAGGYSLAVELAGQDVVMGQFAGLVIGCTMGYILLFDIPVALTVMKKEDRPVLACGLSALVPGQPGSRLSCSPRRKAPPGRKAEPSRRRPVDPLLPCFSPGE